MLLSRSSSSTWSRVAAGAALMLVALLLGDLGDAGCDPLILPVSASIVTTPTEGASDACDEVCIPDCFCCSLITPAVRVAIVTASLETIGPPIPPATPSLAGFAPSLDHVPLAAA